MSIELRTPPLPSSFAREMALILILAFSNAPLIQWFATSPEHSTTDSPEEIPAGRLYKETRVFLREEVEPENFIVCATIEGVVVGFALWRVPKTLRRSESLGEMVYRHVLAAKDLLEDYVTPSWWFHADRKEMFRFAQEECMEIFLGPREIDKMWYLKILAVRPGYQRRGVGRELVNWGLRHAGERGEKVYLEASQAGYPLYVHLGFKFVGRLALQTESEDEIVLPCMLWDPSQAPRMQ
jgi:GNAT superfamily N-acetyltransferase